MYKWIEINLSTIVQNYQVVRETVPPGVKILGVVKADAYGHGLVEVAKELEIQDIDYLGVTELDEAIKLRENRIKKPILVFSPFLLEDIDLAREYGLTITVSNLDTLKYLKEKALAMKVHLKLETGLGRTGFKLQELEQVVGLLQDTEIEVEGLYSHLATAMWDNASFAQKQYGEFSKAIEFLNSKGINIPIRHICNSVALVKFPEMHLDMVRAGNVLYGHGSQVMAGQVEDPWSLKCQITSIADLPKGHSVGYERSYILPQDTKIAIIPVGISHGFSVEPIVRSNSLGDLIKVLGKTILRYFNHPKTKTYGMVGGVRAPVIGKVGMELTILDISHLPEAKIGDTVELPARRTNISPRIPRVFIKGGTIEKIRKLKDELEEVKLAAK